MCCKSRFSGADFSDLKGRGRLTLAAHGPPLLLSRQHIRLNGYRELDSVCTRRTGVTVYVSTYGVELPVTVQPDVLA